MSYEDYLKKTRCHDCAAEPGELHSSGCDSEQCPICGFQAISCNHGKQVLYEEGRCWKDRLPWTGLSFMTEEAVEYGFFARWDGPSGFPSQPGGWVKCGKDHPDAMPSRNDVVRHCAWDPKLKRFVRRVIA